MMGIRNLSWTVGLLGGLAWSVSCSSQDGQTPEDSNSGSGGADGVGGGSGGMGGAPHSGGGSSLDTCRCERMGDCPETLLEYCVGGARPDCPAELDLWVTCSEAGQLSPRGRFGYRLVQQEEHSVVYYVHGFGDHAYWAYDSGGHLVGAGYLSDTQEYVYCGAPSEFRYSFDALGEQLSPSEEASGGAGGAPEISGAAGALIEACEAL